jgi:prevent-host-death family protein
MSVVAKVPVPAEPATGPLPDAIAQAERGNGRVVLTRNGNPVAAVVPISDLQILEEQDAEDEYWTRVADDALTQWDAEGRPDGVSHQELMARYGIKPDPE